MRFRHSPTRPASPGIGKTISHERPPHIVETTKTTPLATEPATASGATSAPIGDPLMASLHLAAPTVPAAAEPQPEPPVSSLVTVGRIVFYRLEHGPHVGEDRPAIVVRVWPGEMVNLQVFTDGANDGEGHQSGIAWATSVHYDASADPATGTWHWPPRT